MSQSYSQYGEDVIIAQLLGDGGSRRLLDIGAWDPITFSNSRLLIEAGWEAVLVEPSPGPLQKLVREYGPNLTRVKIIGAAVTHDEEYGLREMMITDDAVSTSNSNVYRTWRNAGGYYGQLWVPVVPVRKVLERFGDNFEFVNVDTEGCSVDVAIAYVNTGARPRVMCIEHDGRIVELMQAVQQLGYSAKHTNGTNVIIAL